jgi:hypothetical protein
MSVRGGFPYDCSDRNVQTATTVGQEQGQERIVSLKMEFDLIVRNGIIVRCHLGCHRHELLRHHVTLIFACRHSAI